MNYNEVNVSCGIIRIFIASRKVDITKALPQIRLMEEKATVHLDNKVRMLNKNFTNVKLFTLAKEKTEWANSVRNPVEILQTKPLLFCFEIVLGFYLKVQPERVITMFKKRLDKHSWRIQHVHLVKKIFIKMKRRIRLNIVDVNDKNYSSLW